MINHNGRMMSAPNVAHWRKFIYLLDHKTQVKAKQKPNTKHVNKYCKSHVLLFESIPSKKQRNTKQKLGIFMDLWFI